MRNNWNCHRVRTKRFAENFLQVEVLGVRPTRRAKVYVTFLDNSVMRAYQNKRFLVLQDGRYKDLQKTNVRYCTVMTYTKKFQSDIIARVGLFMRWTISQSVRCINEMYYINDRGTLFAVQLLWLIARHHHYFWAQGRRANVKIMVRLSLQRRICTGRFRMRQPV